MHVFLPPPFLIHLPPSTVFLRYNYKFYFNCRWYLESRNTTGCDRYEPPGPAYIFGDPHFRTFNNTAYTFNGKGEYRLLECDNIKFRMHGLFEQAPNNTCKE